ncbi:MAG: hypothetical protein RQ751_09425 [Longimicrobiales bacterium]|nr:hypothetical protein [Longimicrobiales bacterium]
MASIRRRAGIALTTTGLVVATALGSAGQELTWTGTIQYAQGRYIFTETTRSWTLYSGLTWQGERLRLSLGIPVVAQDSRAVTYVGELPLPTGGPDHSAVAQRTKGEPVPMGRRGGSGGGGPSAMGVGVQPPVAAQTSGSPVDSVSAPGSVSVELADPVVSTGFQLLRSRGAFLGLDLTGAVKLPMRDLESGVGTGEFDAGLGVSTAFGGGGTLLFADLSWWRYGDLPDLPLDDVLSYGVGVGRTLGGRWSGLLTLSGSTGVIDNVDPPAELGALVSVAAGGKYGITLGAGVGLTESSPDVSLSLGGRIRLHGR